MKSSGRRRTAITPASQVATLRPRRGHPNESATSLTGSAPGAQLYAHLDTAVGWVDLHVAGPQADPGFHAGGHDLAFENQLGEPPLLAVFLHPDDDSQRALPDT